MRHRHLEKQPKERGYNLWIFLISNTAYPAVSPAGSACQQVPTSKSVRMSPVGFTVYPWSNCHVHVPDNTTLYCDSVTDCGATSAELLLSPVKALVSGCTMVACGAEFTMWLCEGKLFSAGNPQYGQLGHGTDHEYNAKDCACTDGPLLRPFPYICILSSTLFHF